MSFAILLKKPVLTTKIVIAMDKTVNQRVQLVSAEVNHQTNNASLMSSQI